MFEAADRLDRRRSGVSDKGVEVTELRQQGLTYPDIAARLSISLSTASSLHALPSRLVIRSRSDVSGPGPVRCRPAHRRGVPCAPLRRRPRRSASARARRQDGCGHTGRPTDARHRRRSAPLPEHDRRASRLGPVAADPQRARAMAAALPARASSNPSSMRPAWSSPSENNLPTRRRDGARPAQDVLHVSARGRCSAALGGRPGRSRRPLDVAADLHGVAARPRAKPARQGIRRPAQRSVGRRARHAELSRFADRRVIRALRSVDAGPSPSLRSQTAQDP